jgi:hypothetical protein
LFLDQFVAWYWRSRDALALSGVEVDLKGPTEGWGKDSAGLEFESLSQLVTVEVWDSGEFDVMTCLKEDENDPEWEVGELADESAVGPLLDRVARGLAGSAE